MQLLLCVGERLSHLLCHVSTPAPAPPPLPAAHAQPQHSNASSHCHPATHMHLSNAHPSLSCEASPYRYISREWSGAPPLPPSGGPSPLTGRTPLQLYRIWFSDDSRTKSANFLTSFNFSKVSRLLDSWSGLRESSSFLSSG